MVKWEIGIGKAASDDLDNISFPPTPTSCSDSVFYYYGILIRKLSKSFYVPSNMTL